MNNYDTYIHGGLDPGQDENVPLIPAVEVKEPETDFSKDGSDLLSSSEIGESSGTSMLSYPSTGMFKLIVGSLDCPNTPTDPQRLAVHHDTLVTCLQSLL
jgi:hypothetical protein